MAVETVAEVPHDAQPARTHAATRAALARSCARSVGHLALGLALLAAAVLLALDAPRRYHELLSHGTETTGIVRSAHQHGARLGVFFLRMRVDYYVAGVPHSTTVWLPSDAKPRRAGEAVPVVYRRDRPDEATVVGEWNVVWWRRAAEWFLGILAVVPLVSALAVLRGLRRTWQALCCRPWVASEYALMIGDRRTPSRIGLIGSSVDERTADVRIRSVSRRLAPFRRRAPHYVWVATDGDGRPLAIATPGPGRVFTVVRPRRKRR